MSAAGTTAVVMRSVQFRREREATWQELEELVGLAGKSGVRALSAEQLARLPHLYRATLSSLSVARAISLDRALTAYLESLVGRAYFCVYGTRQHLRTQLAEFFAWKLPAAVRRAKWHLVLSTTFFLIGGIVAYAMVAANPDHYYTFAGDMAQGRTPASSTAELRAGLYDEQSFGQGLATFASTLFGHNAQISIVAFALGFVAGIPTFFMMFFNGLVLGAFLALYASRGLTVDLLGWLLPHGVTELLAIFLAGAGGLVLAQALVFPGARPRLDNLRDRGRDAALIAMGAVLMLFIAGLIEGIFRQTVTNIYIRYVVASATAIFWVGYFGFCGRGRAKAAAAVDAAEAAP